MTGNYFLSFKFVTGIGLRKGNFNGFNGWMSGKPGILGIGTTHKDLGHMGTCGGLGA